MTPLPILQRVIIARAPAPSRPSGPQSAPAVRCTAARLLFVLRDAGKLVEIVPDRAQFVHEASAPRGCGAPRLRSAPRRAAKAKLADILAEARAGLCAAPGFELRAFAGGQLHPEWTRCAVRRVYVFLCRAMRGSSRMGPD